ncbi:MAG: alpha/beta fold hydrolase [Hyphomicrobiaceae bacterium]
MSLATTLLLVIAAALAAASVRIVGAYNRDMRRAHAEARQGARVVQTAAGPIEYAETGAGTPLLSIHGAGGGFDQGLANVASFVGGDFRVIAPSRFGYLGTPVPLDTSVAAQADAHAALLAALGIEKAIVVGASAGARSAAAFAIRHPDRVMALILIVPATYAPTSPVMIEASRASALVLRLVTTGADFIWWLLEKCAPSILVRFVGVPPPVLAAASESERHRIMDIVRRAQPLSFRTRGIAIDSQPDAEQPFERIRAPTLVISARDDLFNTLPAARHAAGAIPGAQLVVYDSGGHLLAGRADDAARVVREFLAAQARERSR